MDMKKLQTLISQMRYPNVTVNSLTMFAKSVLKYGQDGLREFFSALCQMDIYKAAKVAQLLSAEHRSVAQEYVSQVLTERCKTEDGISHLELLAIAVLKNRDLLQRVEPYLTMRSVNNAMVIADPLTACNLLQLGLTTLPQKSCVWTRMAFRQRLYDSYDERMEKALPELMPYLLEYDVEDVLSALVKVAGAERVAGFYGEELPGELERLILTGKDSTGVWELYFFLFFKQDPTPEELLEKGLWYVQLFVGDDIYDQVCASFYLHVVTHYGVDHPLFDHMADFSLPQNGFHRYFMRYKDAVRPLWDDPKALSHFVEKTAACNPFRNRRVQGRKYQFLQTAQDRTAYNRLKSLFEAGLSADDILNIFFSTDLKRRLPLEDVFYLAQRYEMLPALLEAFQYRTFTGFVAIQDSTRLFLSSYSYLTTSLHPVTITYQIREAAWFHEKLKGQDLQYTIAAFVNGHIRVEIFDSVQFSDNEEEDPITWEDAIEQLRQEKNLRALPEKQLRKLAITEFTLDDMLTKGNLDLFTGLIMERSDCLQTFRDLMRYCKWNASFLKPELSLPKGFFTTGRQYQQEAIELFRFLLESQESLSLVLELYFFSLYRAIVPLNQLLLLAPKEVLLEKLSNFEIYCSIAQEHAPRCRPSFVCCATPCILQHAEGLSYLDGDARLNAVVTDFEITDHDISRIILKSYQENVADYKEQGSVFGGLANNMYITAQMEQRLATLPSAATYGRQERLFNMSRMEDAIKLRRSETAELKRLLQILGDANPFAFEISTAVARPYLARANKKQDIEDLAISLILNAKSIEDIRDFYLHTHIKYQLRLSELVKLIRDRRSDLVSQIPQMFDGTIFHAIADSQGMLWMPWIVQNTVQVPSEYAGKVLSCTIQLHEDGTVFARVTEAVQNRSFLEILDNCLISGYWTDMSMEALVESLYTPAPTGEAPAEKSSGAYFDYFNRLRRMPHSKQFCHEQFAEGIQTLIVSFEDETAGRIESAVTALVEKWLRLQPDQEKTIPLLYEICRCYIRQYHTTWIAKKVGECIGEHYGNDLGRAFNKQLREEFSRQPEHNCEPAEVAVPSIAE